MGQSPNYLLAVLANTLEAPNSHKDISFYNNLAILSEQKGIDFLVLNDSKEQSVVWDPFTLLSQLIVQTKSIGIGTALSTNYNEPYHLARILATNDHFSKGRVAWQLIKQANFEKASNYNRYVSEEDGEQRATEIIEIVEKLWDSWEDDAVKVDKESGILFEASKVRHINYVGEKFKVRGPNPVPRSPQGRPVSLVILRNDTQWGVLEKKAEVVFLTGNSSEDIEKQYAAFQTHRGESAKDVKYFIPNELKDVNWSFSVSGGYIEAATLETITALQSKELEQKTLRERLRLSRPASQFAKVLV